MSINYELNTHMCKEFSSSMTEIPGCKSFAFIIKALIISADGFFF